MPWPHLASTRPGHESQTNCRFRAMVVSVVVPGRAQRAPARDLLAQKAWQPPPNVLLALQRWTIPARTLKLSSTTMVIGTFYIPKAKEKSRTVKTREAIDVAARYFVYKLYEAT